MTQSLFDLSELSQPRRVAREQSRPSPPELTLVRLALELGATDTGGPLSDEELAVVASARDLPPSDPVEVSGAARAILAGDDPLGESFCRVRPPAARRNSGAFYTQSRLVTPMVEWALQRCPDRIIDPGCGSGRFAAAAVRRHPRLSVLAVDVDPVATLLTRAVLAVLRCRDACVMQCDYTAMEVAPIAGRTAYLGNPPYVRHHDLSPETKAWSLRAARRLGRSISGLAGLHALFFLATALHAAPGDVGCFVTKVNAR
jgi:adenine-specific DNA-methyltransferase